MTHIKIVDPVKGQSLASTNVPENNSGLGREGGIRSS
jgi:hypothetical protein